MTLDQLQSLEPPADVMDAATNCQHTILAGGTPARDLMELVTRWIGRNQQQDRYGK